MPVNDTRNVYLTQQEPQQKTKYCYMPILQCKNKQRWEREKERKREKEWMWLLPQGAKQRNLKTRKKGIALYLPTCHTSTLCPFIIKVTLKKMAFLFFPLSVLWFCYLDKVLRLVFSLSNIELSNARQQSSYRG